MAYKVTFRADTTSGAYAYKQMQAWRAKSRANNKQFLDTMAAVSNTVAGAMINSAQGLGQIAANRAMDRIKTAAAVRQAEMLKSIDSLGLDTLA